MKGNELLQELIKSTHLPSHLIQDELLRLLQKKGLSAEEISLEDLRNLLSDYLQDVLLEAKSHL